MIAVTFRHVCWIEVTRRALELRLATFQPPQEFADQLSGDPVLIEANVITLNANADALVDVQDIMFDEGAGVLVILNEVGQTLTLHFGERSV